MTHATTAGQAHATTAGQAHATTGGQAHATTGGQAETATGGATGGTPPVRPAQVPVVTDADFPDEVLLSVPRPVLVEFTAAWCPPCRQLAPVLHDLAQERADTLKVVQLDVDTDPRTAAAYGVLSMPTLILFREGEPIGSLVGARSGRRLRAEIDRFLG